MLRSDARCRLAIVQDGRTPTFSNQATWFENVVRIHPGTDTQGFGEFARDCKTFRCI